MKNIVEILKKAVRLLLLLLVTSMTAFALMKSSPVDPVQANIGQTALGSMSAEQVEKMEAYWGVGENPVRQYLAWASDFVRGDMGISLLYRQPVADVVEDRLKNSFLSDVGCMADLGSAWDCTGSGGRNESGEVDR